MHLDDEYSQGVDPDIAKIVLREMECICMLNGQPWTPRYTGDTMVEELGLLLINYTNLKSYIGSKPIVLPKEWQSRESGCLRTFDEYEAPFDFSLLSPLIISGKLNKCTFAAARDIAGTAVPNSEESEPDDEEPEDEESDDAVDVSGDDSAAAKQGGRAASKGRSPTTSSDDDDDDDGSAFGHVSDTGGEAGSQKPAALKQAARKSASAGPRTTVVFGDIAKGAPKTSRIPNLVRNDKTFHEDHELMRSVPNIVAKGLKVEFPYSDATDEDSSNPLYQKARPKNADAAFHSFVLVYAAVSVTFGTSNFHETLVLGHHACKSELLENMSLILRVIGKDYILGLTLFGKPHPLRKELTSQLESCGRAPRGSNDDGWDSTFASHLMHKNDHIGKKLASYKMSMKHVFNTPAEYIATKVAGAKFSVYKGHVKTLSKLMNGAARAIVPHAKDKQPAGATASKRKSQPEDKNSKKRSRNS